MKAPRLDTSCSCGPTDDRPEDATRAETPSGAARCKMSSASDAPWVIDTVKTAVGLIRRVSARLTGADRWGTWKARWEVGRSNYKVDPGLYAVGSPTRDAPVLVSANYKMSFDRLRSQLTDYDAWILVLDTRGINVWCAAGKGTFGTDEIVKQVEAARLHEVVSHRRLVLPQLGAPGVAAHEVTRRCKFRVIYGPVRAEDLRAFLDAGMKATPEMRRVRFGLRDRAVLIPVELVVGAKPALIIAAGFILAAGLGSDIYNVDRAIHSGLVSAVLLLAAFGASVILAPTLLPWLPGRAFAAKGLWLGCALAASLTGWAWTRGVLENAPTAAAWLLIIPAITSFATMNFTGASTYTSLSGVRREMRIAVPAQLACAIIGAGLWLTGRFI